MITAARASAIAHGAMPFHNPIAEEAIDRLIDLLPLGPADGALDLGCGRGELLLRLAERTGATGTGIDVSEELIAAARRQAEERLPRGGDGRATFEVLDAKDFEAPPGSFALAACVGSSHALGGYAATLERLGELVRPSGYVVVGEGYWARPPGPEQLEALGAGPGDLPDYAGLLRAGEQHRLEPVYGATSGRADWERYEWAYAFNADRYSHDHPDEEGIELLHARAELARRRRYLGATDGEALGFALVVWRRGAGAPPDAGASLGRGMPRAHGRADT